MNFVVNNILLSEISVAEKEYTEFTPVVEVVAPVAQVVVEEVVTPSFEYNLVPTTEFVKNLDVTFEIVSPVVEQDFFITTPQVRQIEVNEPEFIASNEEQVAFSFDLPVNKVEEPIAEAPIYFDFTSESQNVKINEPVEVVATAAKIAESGKIVHSLEAYMDEYLEVEKSLLESKPAVSNVVTPVNEELNITMKKVEVAPAYQEIQEVNPTEMSIDQMTRLRADERNKTLINIIKYNYIYLLIHYRRFKNVCTE